MSSDWYDQDRDEWLERLRDKTAAQVLKPYADRLPPKDETYWPEFDNYLLSRGLSPRIARANQWYPSANAGDNEPRIVIPATSDQPGNHFWQARLIGCGEKRYQSPHGVASGDACIVVYPTDTGGLTESVVVEGPVCALAAAMTGRLGIALMGADPPEERLGLTYTRVRGTICYIVPDLDRIDALTKVLVYLANRGVECRLRVPSAKDFADMSPLNRERFF